MQQEQYVDALTRYEKAVQELGGARPAWVEAWHQLRRELGARGQELDPLLGHRRVDAMIVGRMLALMIAARGFRLPPRSISYSMITTAASVRRNGRQCVRRPSHTATSNRATRSTCALVS